MSHPLLNRARELGARESGLTVVVTSREDGSFPASVVNAGVLKHPVTGESAVGFVARGMARKLVNLRSRPQATVVFRSGWEWVAVEGSADLVGPDDLIEGMQVRDIPMVLRSVYAAALGGTVDEWAHLDDAFAEEHQTAVLVRPVRIYSNPDES
jgi:hypothetical protein